MSHMTTEQTALLNQLGLHYLNRGQPLYKGHNQLGVLLKIKLSLTALC